MITSDEIALLRGLTKKEPAVFKLGAGDKAMLHARWFVLEVPTSLIAPTFDDWAEVNEHAVSWREKVPPGDGAFGQGSRWTNPDDGVALIKLISDAGVALIHPSIYEVVTKQMPDPEFRVFEGDKPVVVILSAGAMVGGTAQVKV